VEDIRGDDVVRRVGRRAKVDELERGSVARDPPVRADLDRDLGVGVQVFTVGGLIGRAWLEASGGGEVSDGDVAADPLPVADAELPPDGPPGAPA